MFEKIKLWNLKRLHNAYAQDVYYAYARWSNYPVRDHYEIYLSNVALPRAENKLNVVRAKLGLQPVEMVNYKWYEQTGRNYGGKQLHFDWKDILI